MNIKRHLPLLAIIFFITCNDEEADHSIEPAIKSAVVKFIDNPQHDDTIKLTFEFQDGDFDLGLDHRELDSPYHSINLFLENGTGSTTPLSAETLINYNSSYGEQYLRVTPSAMQNGKLITYATRRKAEYNWLPTYHCNHYYSTDILVDTRDSRIISNPNSIQEIIDATDPDYFLVTDTFYVERNPNFYNIEVDFLVAQIDEAFEEYDWLKLFCHNFDGRFEEIERLPIATSYKSIPFEIKRLSKSQGLFIYSMSSIGFKQIFANKKVKLRVKIRDRALHESNEIETNVLQF